MIGIYKITSPTHNIYIGQSWEIEKRFQAYRRLSCKKQVKLYNSLVKYGVSNHVFEILVVLDSPTQQEMDNLEIHYIDLYESAGIKTLNLRAGGKGGRLSQETKDNISKGRSKIITQFDISGNFIRVWESAKCCAKETGLCPVMIRACIRGVCNSTKGYMFRQGQFKSNIDSYNKLYNKNPPFKGVINPSKKQSKHVYQYDMDGDFIESWISIYDAAQSLNINSKEIRSNINNSRKHAGGFQWKLFKVDKVREIIYYWF